MNRAALMLQSVTALINVFGDAYKALNTRERALLREDAEALRVELSEASLDDRTPYDAARVLARRIGGTVNLRAYVDCLVAGAARRKGGQS